MSAKAAKPRRVQSKAARNERRKAAATTLNALGVALLAAALFQPISTGRLPNPVLSVTAFLGFVVSQWILHGRLED